MAVLVFSGRRIRWEDSGHGADMLLEAGAIHMAAVGGHSKTRRNGTSRRHQPGHIDGMRDGGFHCCWAVSG